MTKCTFIRMNPHVALFSFLILTISPFLKAQTIKSETPVSKNGNTNTTSKWEPSEQDQLKIKLVSYQYLQAKDNGEFETAFKAYSTENASAIEFKTWKYNQLIFNATAGAVIDRTFTRISWYESSPDNALPGVFATVDYTSIFSNIDIQCGMLMWHKKDDGSFELIRDQNNFLNKETQSTLSDSEIEQTKTEFGCKKSNE